LFFFQILTSNFEECSQGNSANMVARLHAVLNSTVELCSIAVPTETGDFFLLDEYRCGRCAPPSLLLTG